MSLDLSSRSKTSPRSKEVLWNAERLAEFANAGGREAVEHFHRNNPDFLPPVVWNDANLPVPGDLFFGLDYAPVLRAMGLDIRDTPKPEGQDEITVPAWWGAQQGLRRAWEVGFPLNWCVILISLGHDETPFRVWPYQQAIMLLGVEPWRARFCGTCRKRFVADKPARRFCSTACTGEARKSSRNAWWSDKGKDWREARRRRQQRKRRTKR